MGFSSSFTLYRKHNNFTMSDAEKADIIKRYAEQNKKNDWRNVNDDGTVKDKSIDYSKDLPIVMYKSIGLSYNDRKKMSLADKRDDKYIDYHPVDKLITADFCSNSRFISDELSLGHGDKWTDNECIISKETASAMLEAILYLKAGEYSAKIESVMKNKWIKVFGDEYPKYYRRDRSNKVYIDKLDDGGYCVRLNDDEDEAYYAEDNTSVEYLMDNIETILNAYIMLDENCWRNDTSFVLVYDISY